MTLFKNQIVANLNGYAIIGVKIFFCHGWQNWRQNPPGMKPIIRPLPSVSEVKGFEVSVRQTK